MSPFVTTERVVRLELGRPPVVEFPKIMPRAEHEHVEEITSNRATFQITLGGTLDVFNTAYYLETYSGNMREEAHFEPTEYLIIENIGDVDVVNPYIVVNGRRNWRSADDILKEITHPEMTDEEKALAIYNFLSRIDVQAHNNTLRVGPPFPDEYTHPSNGNFKERADPVKAVNAYYCGGCSLMAANLVILARHAGLEARTIWISPLPPHHKYTIHCIAEVKYNGTYHLFDADGRMFYLDLDNKNIASYEQLHRHPELVARTHAYGFSSPEAERKLMQDIVEALPTRYPPYGIPVDQWLSTMDITLRPNEKLVMRWDNCRKYRYGFNPRRKPSVPYRLANGKIIYRPNLDDNTYRKGIISELNVRSISDDGKRPRLIPMVPNAPAQVLYKVPSPYPIVGATVGGTFYRRNESASCRIYYSSDVDPLWQVIWVAKKLGTFEEYVALDQIIDPLNTPPLYLYYLKYEFQTADEPTDVGLDSVYINTDLQMTSTSLPSLSVGINKIVYQDGTTRPRKVRVTYGWKESSATQPPTPPPTPLFPLNGAKVEQSSLEKLQWEPADDPGGEGVTEYHVQVSHRSDFLIPVSPNFDHLTFNSKPEWKVPKGWLVPGRTYYWRVRAHGRIAWSGWSECWHFTVI